MSHDMSHDNIQCLVTPFHSQSAHVSLSVLDAPEAGLHRTAHAYVCMGRMDAHTRLHGSAVMPQYRLHGAVRQADWKVQLCFFRGFRAG